MHEVVTVIIHKIYCGAAWNIREEFDGVSKKLP